jgi:hypothetical protein
MHYSYRIHFHLYRHLNLNVRICVQYTHIDNTATQRNLSHEMSHSNRSRSPKIRLLSFAFVSLPLS